MTVVLVEDAVSADLHRSSSNASLSMRSCLCQGRQKKCPLDRYLRPLGHAVLRGLPDMPSVN